MAWHASEFFFPSHPHLCVRHQFDSFQPPYRVYSFDWSSFVHSLHPYRIRASEHPDTSALCIALASEHSCILHSLASRRLLFHACISMFHLHVRAWRWDDSIVCCFSCFFIGPKDLWLLLCYLESPYPRKGNSYPLINLDNPSWSDRFKLSSNAKRNNFKCAELKRELSWEESLY